MSLQGLERTQLDRRGAASGAIRVRRASVRNDGRGSDEQGLVDQVDRRGVAWWRRATVAEQQVASWRDDICSCGRVQRDGRSHRIHANAGRNRARWRGRRRAEVVRRTPAVRAAGHPLGHQRPVLHRPRLLLVARRLHRLIAVGAITRAPKTQRKNCNERDDSRTPQDEGTMPGSPLRCQGAGTSRRPLTLPTPR